MNKILFNKNYGMEDAAIAGTKTMLRRIIRFKDFGSRVVRYTPLPKTKGSARYHLEDGTTVVDYETQSTYRVGERTARIPRNTKPSLRRLKARTLTCIGQAVKISSLSNHILCRTIYAFCPSRAKGSKTLQRKSVWQRV